MAATGVDCLLLGSDRIASSGAVSNKVGSLPAALAVKYTPRPTESRSPRVIVVSETEKIALPGDPNKHVVEHNDPKLVSRDWHSAFHSQRVKTSAQRLEEAAGSPALSAFKVEVEVQNVFFEWVPPDLIDVYATEKGILKPDQVNAFALEVVEDAKEMFGDVYGH
ncbi:cell agglutination protein Mam3 [Sporothrix bragantina]|uniref:Cell agglutination protein Mam3 n=1 Tax=Sporothrix bragantina TaxID=671064 RepID=A0ABP0CPB2_9PEZI